MRISLDSDDIAPVVDAVLAELRRRGHELRMYEPEPRPEVALKVASDVAEGRADQGVLSAGQARSPASWPTKSPVRAARVFWLK